MIFPYSINSERKRMDNLFGDTMQAITPLMSILVIIKITHKFVKTFELVKQIAKKLKKINASTKAIVY